MTLIFKMNNRNQIIFAFRSTIYDIQYASYQIRLLHYEKTHIGRIYDDCGYTYLKKDKR